MALEGQSSYFSTSKLVIAAIWIQVITTCIFGSEADLGADRSGENSTMSTIANSKIDGFSPRFIGRRIHQTYSDVEELPAWRGRIDPDTQRSYMAPAIAVNKCHTGRQKCSTSLGKYPYEEYIIDPTGDSSQPVIKVGYPKGTWSPGSAKPGGTLFFLYPYKTHPQDTINPISFEGVSVEYEVYFPKNFDFVKGGKLPGIAGGNKNGRGCGGGVSAESCFSYRVMWRTDGNGEAYLYADRGVQANQLCESYPRCGGNKYPCTYCNPGAGVSYGRGTFKFKKGQWNKIKISMILNDVGKKNGYLDLEFNGKKVLSFDKMVWRTSNDIYIEGVDFSTWFGGSDDTWSPSSDTYTLFRNMKAYRTGAPTIERSSSRAASLSASTVDQVVIEEYMDVAE